MFRCSSFISTTELDSLSAYETRRINVIFTSLERETTWKGNYRSTDNIKEKERRNFYRKNKNTSGRKLHKHTSA